MTVSEKLDWVFDRFKASGSQKSRDFWRHKYEQFLIEYSNQAEK